jgi:hypothetical protein
MQFLSLRSNIITKRFAVGAAIFSSTTTPIIIQQTCNHHTTSCCGGTIIRRQQNVIINNTTTSAKVCASSLLSSAIRTAMTEVRPGDWLCANCGENNFRFRTHCNLCSKPRSPGAEGSNAGEDSNNNSNSRPSNRSSSNRGSSTQQRGFGDWTCGTCNSLNFKFRTECYSCREPRSAADIAAAAAASRETRGPKGSDLTEANMKPGDWKCTDCGSINFRGRASCFTCRTPKSSSAVTKAGGGGDAVDAGGRSRAKDMKKGDWLCQSCSEHNFADRAACFRCGLPRGEAKGYQPTGDESSAKNVSRRPPRSAAEEQPAMEGDWMCSECGTNNFRRRMICYKCKKPKSAAATATDSTANDDTTNNNATSSEDAAETEASSSEEAEPKQTTKKKSSSASSKKKKEEKPDDPLDDL